MRECGAGDQRVTEGHLSELAEFDRLTQNVLRQRQDWGGGEERLKMLAFLLGQAMLAWHFDVADCGHGRCVFRNEFTQSSVSRLHGVGDDVAINQHPASLPGNARSWRISRSQVAASLISANA